MSSVFRVASVGTALAIVLYSSGCAKLEEVAELSKLTESLRSSLPIVSSDIAASCERRGQLLTEIPDEEKASTDKPQDCSPFHAIADQVAVDQSVLIAYLDALARLAENRPLAYRANIAGNLTTLSGFTDVPPRVAAASTAAQKILSRLADLATGDFRAQHVEKLLETTDPALQQLTAALKDVVSSDYPILLENERTSLANYYEGPMAARRGERLALILVQRQYDSDTASLANRFASAQAYGRVMMSVAATHAALTAEAHSGKSKKSVQVLGSSLTDLKEAIADLSAIEKR